jgi:hypothetical protein
MFLLQQLYFGAILVTVQITIFFMHWLGLLITHQTKAATRAMDMALLKLVTHTIGKRRTIVIHGTFLNQVKGDIQLCKEWHQVKHSHIVLIVITE